MTESNGNAVQVVTIEGTKGYNSSVLMKTKGQTYGSQRVDRFNPEQRSWVMSRVRGKNTKPEKLVRSFLHEKGYRFRLHDANLPGSPDIVLTKFKTVIFVNGCFWHQHSGCKKATIPVNNRDFWERKLSRTIIRDLDNRHELEKLGWQVITLWECELKTASAELFNSVLAKIEAGNRSRTTTKASKPCC